MTDQPLLKPTAPATLEANRQQIAALRAAGLTYEEIAQRMVRPVSARARKRMERELEALRAVQAARAKEHRAVAAVRRRRDAYALESLVRALLPGYDKLRALEAVLADEIGRLRERRREVSQEIADAFARAKRERRP